MLTSQRKSWHDLTNLLTSLCVFTLMMSYSCSSGCWSTWVTPRRRPACRMSSLLERPKLASSPTTGAPTAPPEHEHRCICPLCSVLNLLTTKPRRLAVPLHPTGFLPCKCYYAKQTPHNCERDIFALYCNNTIYCTCTFKFY